VTGNTSTVISRQQIVSCVSYRESQNNFIGLSSHVADQSNVFQAVITVTNISLEFAGDRWHNKGSTNFRPMQRYSITTPLIAVRLFRSHETEKAGVMTALPPKAVVEIHGPSDVGDGMIAVAWEHQRFAVF
jgi:hypothetical protein